ncbi:MAG: diaminopimelate epimerase, partial [Thermodesulfobacteriota bacterium]|nr:diaminopimelate epimerase [Thermodesulfobacteriota bacterium]
MIMPFQKMHGTLNDFIVIEDLGNRVLLSPADVAKLCDRRAGIGGDGVIVVRQSCDADFFMDYLNSDGSVAEMCGNGIRCLAKYVYDCGLARQKNLTFQTRAGIKTVEIITGDDGLTASVRVGMGFPAFAVKEIPVALDDAAGPVIDWPVEVRGRTFLCSFISMGNPHCVIFQEGDIEDLPSRYGPDIETHSLFPQKTNVEFVKVVSRSALCMRVWERGSGITLSCGTGACASAVAARLKGLVDSPVEVQLLGGRLSIEW